MQARKARVFNWVPLVTALLAASCFVTPKTYPVGGKTQKPDAGSANESDDDAAECIPGEESCECFRNDTCDDGLACVSDRCVDLSSLSDDDTDDDTESDDEVDDVSVDDTTDDMGPDDDDTDDDDTEPDDDVSSDDTGDDDVLEPSDDTSDDTADDVAPDDDVVSDDDANADDTADPGDDALANDTTDDDTSEPDDTTFWASWPMPNPASSGLPNPASYTIDEAAGVVTDDVTGLMWQRSVASSYAWEAAVAHCDSLSLGDYDDWRLPSRIELVSLLDHTRSSPVIDVTAFPNTPSAYFWTPSAIVSFENGRVTMYRDDSLRGSQRNLVRCVRTHEVQSGSTVERYTVEGDSPDDQVTDNRTGLVWQRMASSSTYNWDTAQAYCAELSLGGVTGWRVPSVKELLTIVDDVRRNPAIDPLAFPNTPISTFMTGSLVSGYSPYSPAVLRVEFGGGDTSEYYRSNSAQLRCVR